MKNVLLSITVITMLTYCAPKENNQNTDTNNSENQMSESETFNGKQEINWEFEKTGNNLMPAKKCSITISNKVTKVDSVLYGEFIELDKPEFEAFDIPATAISACSGEWNNQRTLIYLEQNNLNINVKCAVVDLTKAEPEINFNIIQVIQP